MKKIMSVLAVSVLCCNFAFAANTAKFENTLNTQGLDQAVVEAMAEGTSLNVIMTEALAIEGMNPQSVIIALLSAGADVGAVATVAANNGVSAQIIARATQQFTSKAAQDTQAYTKADPNTQAYANAAGRASFIASIPVSGVPGGGGGGGAPAERYASPSGLRK